MSLITPLHRTAARLSSSLQATAATPANLWKVACLWTVIHWVTLVAAFAPRHLSALHGIMNTLNAKVIMYRSCTAPAKWHAFPDMVPVAWQLDQRDKVRGRAAPRGFPPRRAMMQSWAFSSSASIICGYIAWRTIVGQVRGLLIGAHTRWAHTKARGEPR